MEMESSISAEPPVDIAPVGEGNGATKTPEIIGDQEAV
jgi:hypothetical protein